MTGKRKLAGGYEISEAGLLTGLLDAHVKFVKCNLGRLVKRALATIWWIFALAVFTG